MNIRRVSKQSLGSDEGKYIMEHVVFNPRRPKTQATNKLRLNFRVAWNPGLKDPILIIDEAFS